MKPELTYDVAVYSLSRGKGVPEGARQAYAKARAMFEQMRSEKRSLEVKETRIGIEGERRLCASFASQEEAEVVAERLRSLGEGVELFNVAMEPCARTSGARELPQGEKP